MKKILVVMILGLLLTNCEIEEEGLPDENGQNLQQEQVMDDDKDERDQEEEEEQVADDDKDEPNQEEEQVADDEDEPNQEEEQVAGDKIEPGSLQLPSRNTVKLSELSPTKSVTCSKEDKLSITYTMYEAPVSRRTSGLRIDGKYLCVLDSSLTTYTALDWTAIYERNFCREELERLVNQREAEGSNWVCTK